MNEKATDSLTQGVHHVGFTVPNIEETNVFFVETLGFNQIGEVLDYRLIKELWTFADDRIAVRFAYESRDDGGNWYRSYGNENWEFDEQGLMKRRIASINDLPIAETDRKLHWQLGRRPDEHPGLTKLGL